MRASCVDSLGSLLAYVAEDGTCHSSYGTTTDPDILWSTGEDYRATTGTMPAPKACVPHHSATKDSARRWCLVYLASQGIEEKTTRLVARILPRDMLRACRRNDGGKMRVVLAHVATHAKRIHALDQHPKSRTTAHDLVQSIAAFVIAGLPYTWADITRESRRARVDAGVCIRATMQAQARDCQRWESVAESTRTALASVAVDARNQARAANRPLLATRFRNLPRDVQRDIRTQATLLVTDLTLPVTLIGQRTLRALAALVSSAEAKLRATT